MGVGGRQLGTHCLSSAAALHEGSTIATQSRGILTRISSIFSLWTTKNCVNKSLTSAEFLSLNSLVTLGAGNTHLLASLFSNLRISRHSELTNYVGFETTNHSYINNTTLLRDGFDIVGNSRRNSSKTNVAGLTWGLFSSRSVVAALPASGSLVNAVVSFWSPQFGYLVRPGFLPFSGAATSFFDIFERFAKLTRGSEKFSAVPHDSFVDRAFFFPTVDTLSQANLMYCSLFFYNLFEVTSYLHDSGKRHDLTAYKGAPVVESDAQQLPTTQSTVALEGSSQLDIFSEVFRSEAALPLDGSFQNARRATASSENSTITQTDGLFSAAGCVE